MTLKQVKRKVKRRDWVNSFLKLGYCLFYIALGFVVLCGFISLALEDIRISVIAICLGFIFIALFFLVCGLNGLYVLKQSYKVNFLHNEFTQEKNIEILSLACSEFLQRNISFDENYANFFYKRKWYSRRYEVYLFADKNIIALNVREDSLKGEFMTDFGKLKKIRNIIFNLIKEKAGCYTNDEN